MNPRVKQYLHQLGSKELTIAITEMESFVELDLRKDKFKPSKPKKKDNGREIKDKLRMTTMTMVKMVIMRNH